jgi:hypothetical protein
MTDGGRRSNRDDDTLDETDPEDAAPAVGGAHGVSTYSDTSHGSVDLKLTTTGQDSGLLVTRQQAGARGG